MNASRRSSGASETPITGTRDAPGASQTPAPSDRGELFAGITFVEGSRSGWGAWDLTGWFEDNLVVPGRMTRPSIVAEPGVGVIALDPRSPVASRATLTAAELPRLVTAARDRVVTTLRCFICVPSDDRFLSAAIFAGRVARGRDSGEAVWSARPSESDRLSDIALSLFAADVLMHREFHEANLCVCEVCGRVSFTPAVVSRNGCREHPPHNLGDSGFFHRTMPSESDE
jgi:hypothetical protein